MPTKSHTSLFVGSVRWVEETGVDVAVSLNERVVQVGIVKRNIHDEVSSTTRDRVGHLMRSGRAEEGGSSGNAENGEKREDG